MKTTMSPGSWTNLVSYGYGNDTQVLRAHVANLRDFGVSFKLNH